MLAYHARTLFRGFREARSNLVDPGHWKALDSPSARNRLKLLQIIILGGGHAIPAVLQLVVQNIGLGSVLREFT